MTPHKEERRVFEATPEGKKILGDLIRRIRESIPPPEGKSKYAQQQMVTDIRDSVYLGPGAKKVDITATTLGQLEKGVSINDTLLWAIAAMRYDVPLAKNPKTGKHWTAREFQWISWEIMDLDGNFL